MGVEWGDAETEAVTADFTWVLYIPRGEVGLSAPPSDKGTEGRGLMWEEESCPTAALINMHTCSLWRYPDQQMLSPAPKCSCCSLSKQLKFKSKQAFFFFCRALNICPIDSYVSYKTGPFQTLKTSLDCFRAVRGV